MGNKSSKSKTKNCKFAKLPTKRSDFGICNIDSNVYIVGGEFMDSYHDTIIWMFDCMYVNMLI